jgi:hypothetical protein
VSTFCQVDYVIHVPDGVSVIARSDGADVTVSNVTGNLDLSSSGGGIRVRNSDAGHVLLDSNGSGIAAVDLSAESIRGSASGGSVFLSLSTPPKTVDVDSDGGSVEIVLPDTSDAYHVNVSADGGSTSTEIRTDPTSPRVIIATSSGGNVILRYG